MDTKEIENMVVAAFIDAIKYESKWKIPFTESKTKESEFNLFDGKSIQVPTMNNTFKNYPAISDNEKEIFAINGKENTRAFFIKPKNKNKLTFENLKKYLKEFKESDKFYDIDFYLPKFETKSEVDFMKLFPKLNLERMINSFKIEKIVEDVDVFVSKAKQLSYMKIDEKGAVAKAITKIETKETSAPPQDVEKITIKMDSPFYVIIEDFDKKGNSDLIIFTSYIANPTK